MIVPMKKVSLIIRGEKKTETLKTLRKLGLVHVEISEGSGEKLAALREEVALLESATFLIGKKKKAKQEALSVSEAQALASRVLALDAERKRHIAEKAALNAELERVKSWGDLDPRSILDLQAKGLDLSLYEMPKSEYDQLGEDVKTLRLEGSKSTVKFMLLLPASAEGDALRGYRLKLPQKSTAEMRRRIEELEAQITSAEEEIASHVCHIDSLKAATGAIEKEIEFETYATGMADEDLASEGGKPVSVACFTGYIAAENVDRLKKTASAHAWGLLVEEPDEEDNVPTELRNNKFVSLIYPLTDFLGTVPGYFEYDISGWFLGFILIFFGIIFGDGGYGLLICAITLALMGKARMEKKAISPAFLLAGLFGLSTILWGTLTCTWFGIPAAQLPKWLQSLSIPVISNVYADKIWYPFWTKGAVGLTTAQNLQIFCFTLALVQLGVAHIMGAVRNRRSVKLLGDVGSLLQLVGIYYLVLSLVVNAEVFSFGLVIGAVPVGKVAIALIAVGFVLSFVFSNYAGSIFKSILASVKNIVSVLLGVVNVFSDIVSYIRLWAVGLAGAAIAATVNELAGPLFGKFLFMILAIVLLVFGHGLNMILNILSVIVHGIRLNTLEFSSHLDMSWSGHKFKPFKE